MRVETGPLDGEDLSPMSALPQLLEAARSGYMAECSLEEGEQRTLLQVRYADPDQPPGEGRETTLWLDPDTHAWWRGRSAWTACGSSGAPFQNLP